MQQENNFIIISISYFISYFITILRIFWSVPIFYNITDFLWFFGTGLLIINILGVNKKILIYLLLFCIGEEFWQLLIPNYMNYDNNILSLFFSGTFDSKDILAYILSYISIILYLRMIDGDSLK